MLVALTLKIKVIMTELVADDFSKGLKAMFLIEFWVEIQVSILGKEPPSSGPETLVPQGLMLKFPAKIFYGNSLNIIS